jgi:hypothetical protein
MKKKILFSLLIIISLSSKAQYEQKVSIDVSSGIFKTFGKKSIGEMIMQMPNYKMGFLANGGLQFRLSNRLSLSTEFGLTVSQRWAYNGKDFINDLSWTISDTITNELLESGNDYLDIYNYGFSLKPKYYLFPDKKLNPYFFCGVNINWTCAYFENTEWAAYKKLGWLSVEDTVPGNDNLENSVGIGFNPGIGVEYSPNDRFHFYLESGYYVIMLEKDKFKDPLREENFNALILQAGLRLNFIKSKDL